MEPLPTLCSHVMVLTSGRYLEGFDKFPYQGQWTRCIKRQQDEHPHYMDGSVDSAASEWMIFITSEIGRKHTKSQLKSVHRYPSSLLYSKDLNSYGRIDHWATPKEFLELGKGDCEDFAIFWYYTLRFLNWNSRILIIDLIRGTLRHAVCIVEYREKWHVLDVSTSLIWPLSKFKDYAPVYSLNETGWWNHRIRKAP